MCDGGQFFPDSPWELFAPLAKARFPGVRSEPGVYGLRVKAPGEVNLEEVIARYKWTRFFTAMKELEISSGELFKDTGLADNYHWKKFSATIGSEKAEARFDRIRKIKIHDRELPCRVPYIGSSSDLRRRFNELAYGGHTANHPIWALLLAKWELAGCGRMGLLAG